MSKLTIALLIGTVASAGTSTYFWRELESEREERTALQTRIAQLEKTRAAVAAPPPVVEPEPESPPTSSAAAVAPSAKAPPPQAKLAAIGGSGVFTLGSRPGIPDAEMRKHMIESHEQQMRLLKDPEYRELMRAQQKHGMYQMYADLEPLVGLTKDESERLLDVLAEQSLRQMEQQRPVFGPIEGGQPSEAEIRERQRIFEEQRRKNEAEIAGVLGPKFNEWQDYQKNSWSRMHVTRLRQTLSSTDEPLRQEQIKPLVDAIAREQQHALTPMRTAIPNGRPDAQTQARMAEEWLERTAQSHERIRTAVQGLLSPSQFERLQQQQEQELKMQELSVKQQRARAEAQARGEIPPDPAPAPGMFQPVVTYAN